jgi:glycosyltransferase involved in cell wall biosynthesis
MSAPTPSWHLLTPEYPPDIGGVADYTHSAAEEIRAQGRRVFVWHPRMAVLAGGYTPANLIRLNRAIDGEDSGPRRLFVQWVPHGFGYRSMNLPFCVWLFHRARRGDHVDLMVHEASLPFQRGRWRQNAVAAIHRLMGVILLRAANRIWLSTPSWEPRLRLLLLGRKKTMEWLPVASNIPVHAPPPNPGGETATPRVPRIGHFGTYSRDILDYLWKVVPSILSASPSEVLLLGKGSEKAAASFGDSRVRGKGLEDAKALSLSIASCDAFLQPYPDGISARRSSAMAGLAHGKAIVTNAGLATESIWRESGAVAWANWDDPASFAAEAARLLLRRAVRDEIGGRASSLYERHFSIQSTMRRLVESGWSPR